MGNNEMNTGNTLATPEKSSTGMDANLAALLSYLLGFITGIVFFILEKDSKYVKFHAMQSILVSVAIMIVNFILGLIPILDDPAFFNIGRINYPLDCSND